MKKVKAIWVLIAVVFVVVLLIMITKAIAAEAPKVTDPSKHELFMTVKFNSVTLEKAVELEKKIKAAFSDACSIKIRLEQLGESNLVSFGTLQGNITLLDAGNYLQAEISKQTPEKKAEKKGAKP